MAVDYSQVAGYLTEADLSLGCGLPTETANIREGDTVVDLGSGAGNDVFVARRLVGDTGQVIGVDMTPEMVIRAWQNNQKLGYRNVAFVLGDIENMEEMDEGVADVVISNCVMNLVPDKERAFHEVHRVLREGGHFSISDIVYQGHLPEEVREAAEMYAGCVAGAKEKGEYLGIIKAAGFKNIQIKRERRIELSDEVLLQYVSAEALATFKTSGAGVYSITVYADKQEVGACCEASAGACCGSEEDHRKATETAAGACCASSSSSTVSCCGS